MSSILGRQFHATHGLTSPSIGQRPMNCFTKLASASNSNADITNACPHKPFVSASMLIIDCLSKLCNLLVIFFILFIYLVIYV